MKKVNLIRWLHGNTMLLQHLDQNNLLTWDEYNKLKKAEDSQIVDLIDIVLSKGENICLDFLHLLAQDDVNESSPELRAWARDAISDKPKLKKATKRKAETSTDEEDKENQEITQHDKQSKLCVKGYIHSVSEVLVSRNKNKYFTAWIQQAETFSKLVVWEVKDRQKYVSAENNRTPVKLENIKYDRKLTGEEDILAGWNSKLSPLEELSFPFDLTKKQEKGTENKTIEDILKNLNNKEQVNVTVKIMEERENGAGVIRAKKMLSKTVFAVSDKSGSLELTVWEKHNLSVGKWYLFTNLSVTKFQGKITLSTTPQTTTEEVADAGAVVEAVMDDADIITGEIVTTNIVIESLCPKRHVLDMVNPKKITWCPQCGAYVKNDKITTEFQGKMLLNDEDGRDRSFKLTHQVLHTVLKIDTNTVLKSEDLSAQLLQCSKAVVLCRGRRVVSISLPSREYRLPQPLLKRESDDERKA